MKPLVLVLLLGFCGCFFVSGCGSNQSPMSAEELAAIPYSQVNDLPAATGGVVMSVNGETVTASEIIDPLVDIYKDYARQVDIELFKSRSRADVRDLVTDKIFGILIYQEGKKAIGENTAMLEKAVDEQVRKFVIKFRNDTFKAEEELRSQGLNWESFRKEKERELLSQMYLSSQMPQPGPVTHGEMLRVYEEIKGEAFKTDNPLQVKIIDIEPGRLAIADANMDCEQAAVELAKQLVERINSGEDFEKLAREHSSHYSKSSGGLWEIMDPKAVAGPYSVLVKEAEKTDVGQVAGPVQAEGHVFVLKLVQKYGINIKPFEEVQQDIENRILYYRQLEVHKELTERLLRKAEIGNKDRFVEYCLEEIYRRCQKIQ